MGKSLNTPPVGKQVPRMGNKFSQWLGNSTLRMLGWNFSGTFPNSNKMIIAVAPHTSNWDFVIGLAVAFSLRLKISFFGKHSIFIPPFDRLLKRWGGIPVERSKAHGIVEQMANEMASAEQMVLCLSPEGTRSRIDRWKTGFLHIAHKADVPILLVAFDYKKKLIEFGPSYKVSDDVEHELSRIYQHFSTATAKYPEKVVCKVDERENGEVI